jgi:hypothetical protein
MPINALFGFLILAFSYTRLHNLGSDDFTVAVQLLISSGLAGMTVPISQMPNQHGMTIPCITGPQTS